MGKEGTIRPMCSPCGDHMRQLVWVLLSGAQMGDSQISQFAQMGATWVSMVQNPNAAHMGEVICPDGDHNLTLMAQLPPMGPVLLAG
jgi:hypothetical protein